MFRQTISAQYAAQTESPEFFRILSDSLRERADVLLDTQHIYGSLMQPPSKKLLDQVRDAIQLKHYAYRTEETYVQWIRRYIFVPQQGKSLELWDCLWKWWLRLNDWLLALGVDYVAGMPVFLLSKVV